MGAPRVIDFEKLYHSNNYGDFRILREVPRNGKTDRRVEIVFCLTNHKSTVPYSEALNGCVKDTFYPSIHGVGYLGNAHKKGNERFYNIWFNMLGRCYNSAMKEYKYYGAKGCYVDKKWHCFESFLNDVFLLPGSGLLELDDIELDKDILQPNTSNKCYSITTCCWVRKDTNNREHLVRKNSEENYSSKYIGVCADRRYKIISYQAQINLNGKQKYIGRFDDEVAAANAYNYYADLNGVSETKNNCPFMTVDEWEKHKLKRGKKENE